MPAMFGSALAIGAITLSAALCGPVSALTVVPGVVGHPTHSVASHGRTAPENDLRARCSSHVKTECVLGWDDDGDGITLISRANQVHTYTDGATVLRYLRHGHGIACAQEDSPHCYRDATTTGNHIGWSFIVIGGKAEDTGTVVYLNSL